MRALRLGPEKTNARGQAVRRCLSLSRAHRLYDSRSAVGVWVETVGEPQSPQAGSVIEQTDQTAPYRQQPGYQPIDFPPVRRADSPAPIDELFVDDAPAKIRMRARDLLRPSRRVILAVLAFGLVAPSNTLAAADSTTIATTASGDRAATRALLEADYRLTKATLTRFQPARAAEARAAEALGRECKGVLHGAPDESVIEEEGPSVQQPRLSGRAQGERARSEQEKQKIGEEINETIFAAADRVLRDPYDAYIATIDRLTWSDPTINALVHQRTVRLRENLTGPPVSACGEMRAWAASGFHVLPAGIKRLEEAREARDKQAVQGDLGALLRPYESSADRVTIRRITALGRKLSEAERNDNASLRAHYRMELALGEKPSRFAEQQAAPVIGKGRTSAGTTFVIRRSVGTGFSRSCRHEVEVEVREGNGGESGGVCLNEGNRSQPSSSCSGSVETVELATTPGVRRARVRLGNGRTITVSVVQISAKDGGPAGIFIDAFRGYNAQPVSLQELSRNGRVVRTVSLNRVRCSKRLPTEAPEPPQFVDLATVTTPSGEPLTIEGMLLRFRDRTEFSLGPQTVMHRARTGEERTKAKQFQWELSTECAPHPYSLIAGILRPPGASVLARTPAGLTPLTKVELATSLHAEGPLFYGIYVTPPTEIVVERSDGSVLYTESLAAQAAEETEFCEGYAER